MQPVVIGTEDRRERLASSAMHGTQECLFARVAMPAFLYGNHTPVGQPEAGNIQRICVPMFG